MPSTSTVRMPTLGGRRRPASPRIDQLHLQVVEVAVPRRPPVHVLDRQGSARAGAGRDLHSVGVPQHRDDPG